MLWGERVTRRRAIVGILVLFALADAGLGFAVLRADGSPRTVIALPLHPVAGNFVPDDLQLWECSDERCFQQAFGNIAYYEGPEAALALIEDVYGDGGSAACHRATHAIGAASLARYRGRVGRTFAAGSSTCGSGYYHGVLERSLVNVQARTPNALGVVARTLCTDIRTREVPWVAYQCFHGLGHGLMIATGLSVPLSLEVCKRLTMRWDRDVCKGGVFMENLSGSYGFRSRWLRDDDPVYPCNWVDREDKSRCYQMVTSRILPSVGDDWDRTAEVCSEVESDFVYMCFQSLGRDASSRSNRNPSSTAEICAVARPYGGEGNCIAGAARDVAFNYTSGSRATALCDVVSANVRGDCYFGIGTIMGQFRKADELREADCREIATAALHMAACMRGGRSTLPHAKW
jgi:hypothetical protein